MQTTTRYQWIVAYVSGRSLQVRSLAADSVVPKVIECDLDVSTWTGGQIRLHVQKLLQLDWREARAIQLQYTLQAPPTRPRRRRSTDD